MVRISFYAALLAAGLCFGEGLAQDAPASNLPPIFAPGNHVTLAGRSGVVNIVIQEVRGEWILATVSGQDTPAWLRPASMDATWSQAH